MRVEAFTPENLSLALRRIRLSAGLTQQAVSERTVGFKPPLISLRQTKISDFECGRTQPNLVHLVALLVACSADGKTLDFTVLQEALVEASGEASFATPSEGLLGALA